MAGVGAGAAAAGALSMPAALSLQPLGRVIADTAQSVAELLSNAVIEPPAASPIITSSSLGALGAQLRVVTDLLLPDCTPLSYLRVRELKPDGRLGRIITHNAPLPPSSSSSSSSPAAAAAAAVSAQQQHQRTTTAGSGLCKRLVLQVLKAPEVAAVASGLGVIVTLRQWQPAHSALGPPQEFIVPPPPPPRPPPPPPPPPPISGDGNRSLSEGQTC